MKLTTSVIVVTLNRPDYMRRCLDCLISQEPPPDQIIVVDASKDDLTEKVVATYPGVLYLRNTNGFGRMTASRNIGVKQAIGEIIAFVDDDAFAHPGWLQNLLAAYEGADADVGAIGGRALDNIPGEEKNGVEQIGRLRPNGVMNAHFGADPGKIIEVDHMLGANMSFRREVIARLGGFREDYPGISGICEDSDMCMRVKRLGYRILFTPTAKVDHLAAPQAQGKRFDNRYCFYHRRNNFTLFFRNDGVGALVFKYLLFTTVQSFTEFIRKIGGAVLRLGALLAGAIVGIWCGLHALLFKGGRDPVRHDPDGEEIRRLLQARADETASNRIPTNYQQPATGNQQPITSNQRADKAGMP